MQPKKTLSAAWRVARPAPKAMLAKAAQHEANYYRPFLDAGRILGRRARHIAEGTQPSQLTRRPLPLQIGRKDGQRYAVTTVAIVGFCGYAATHGDPGALMLLPVALVPGLLAWAGLRHSKR